MLLILLLVTTVHAVVNDCVADSDVHGTVSASVTTTNDVTVL